MITRTKMCVITVHEDEATSTQPSRKKSTEFLARNQTNRASLLLVEQEGSTPEALKSQKDAEALLKREQRKAAEALKKTQEENAVLLKHARKTAAHRLKEKDQVIAWLSGGYSYEQHPEG